jgi:glycosyltransferase involved in cell wall biosynthesis
MEKTNEKINKNLSISAFIISKNEGDRISQAIKSLASWVSDTVVVDSGSTDDTIEVAKESGADKVVYNEWGGYGKQKSYAESLCKNDWIINIDADEEVSCKLKDEILALIKSHEAEKFSAFFIDIVIAPRFSKKIPNFGPKDRCIRLYNKKFANFKTSPVHDSVEVHSGKIGYLKNIIIHRSFRSYSHAINKINSYTDIQAIDSYEKNKLPSAIRIIIEPFWTFLKAYLLNRYFFLGFEGVIEAGIYSFSKTLRLIKTREKFLIDEIDH